MINIVKYPKYEYTRHRFTCSDCECIFDADASDYSYTVMPAGYNKIKEYIYIKCPICGHLIVVETKDIKNIKAIPNTFRSDIQQYIEND